jgi:hypothetical protein
MPGKPTDQGPDAPPPWWTMLFTVLRAAVLLIAFAGFADLLFFGGDY